MTTEELKVLGLFRRYLVRPAEMLLVYAQECRVSTRRLLPVMRGLVAKGLVVKERPPGAYSLTPEGYRCSKACRSQPDSSRAPCALLNQTAGGRVHVRGRR